MAANAISTTVEKAENSHFHESIQSGKSSYSALNVVVTTFGARRMSRGASHELVQNSNTYLLAEQLQRTVKNRDRWTL